MQTEVTATMENGDRIYCCPHDDGSVSILSGHMHERVCIRVHYAAAQATVAAIQAGIDKAKALRTVHYPEKPKCDTDTTAAPDGPSDPLSGTDDPAGG